MKPLAAIFGLSGPRLTPAEISFFKDADPWAFILFARNVETPEQVRRLTSSLRDTVGRDCLIFVDQEGGRVQRLTEPHWPKYPSYRHIAREYAISPSAARQCVYLHHRLIAHDLREVGINADCAPVLDIPVAGADPIISDRAFGEDFEIVSSLGHAAMAGMMRGGVAPVIKHIPGHGRATVDSHLELPVIDAGVTDLRRMDFFPFSDLSLAPMAMTAHAVYTAVDPEKPATLSARVISRVIRHYMGFDGLLMTDDLDMKALQGSLTERAEQSLDAGCDVVLQCSGKLPDMVAVAKGGVYLSGDAARRAEIAELSADKVVSCDIERLRALYHRHLDL